MNLDDIRFDNDEDRRKYLTELAKLKKIREEEEKTKEKLKSYIKNEASNDYDLDVPNFNRNDNYDDYDNNQAKQALNNRISKNSPTYNGNNKKKKNKKKKKKKKIILFLQILLLCFIGFCLYVAFILFNAKEKGFYTVAIFGLDSRDGKLGKGALADVNMIASINKETGDVNLVSVYRDSYTEIDGKGTFHKLNEAYFKGGPKQAVDALERNLDIKIDDYATFNWKAVAQTINILGGIDLEITKPEFKYINSFITETVNSTKIGSVQLKNPGMQHLDGIQSVAYARLRLMDTDFNRTQRQRKVVELTLDKAKQADFLTLNHILTTIFPQISTSLSLNDILPFAKNVGKYHLAKTTGFPFEKTTKVVNKRDYVIVVSLEDNVIELHKFLYGDNIFYTPSSYLKNLSKQIMENTGIYKDKNTNINVELDSDKTKNKVQKNTNIDESIHKSEIKEQASKEQESKALETKIQESESEADTKQDNIDNKNDPAVLNIEEDDELESKKHQDNFNSKNNDDIGNGPDFDASSNIKDKKNIDGKVKNDASNTNNLKASKQVEQDKNIQEGSEYGPDSKIEK